MINLPLVIYCTYDVPRIRYIAGLIFGDILGLKWKLVTDRRKLGKNPVINYSDEKLNNSFKINPISLLFEKGVKKQEIVVCRYNGLPYFFPSDEPSDFPFDILAACFFLVTRYEEYIDSEPDGSGRFKASSSIAFRNDFLQIPLIDLWVKELTKSLLKKFQMLTFRRNEYNALLTIDADSLPGDHGINIPDLLGGLLDFKKKIPITGEKDQQDGIEYILNNIEANGTDTNFFFTVGNPSRHDRYPSWKSEKYRTLICNIAHRYGTGLHPSLDAASRYPLMAEESARLKKILSREVTSNRFHHLKYKIPDSHINLIKAGITEEYSMGYHDEAGFRAGIARPFYFYDVLSDNATALKIIPFQFSDSLFDTFRGDITGLILKLINETRKAGGLFVSSWHNSSLSMCTEMNKRREVFEFMLKNQVP